MSHTGRPTRTESLRRKARFLSLVADGLGVLEAARAAKVKPERALAIIASPEQFHAVVSALRAGGAPVAVILDPTEGKVAA